MFWIPADDGQVISQLGGLRVARGSAMSFAIDFAHGEPQAFRGTIARPRGARQRDDESPLWLQTIGAEHGVVARTAQDGQPVACGCIRPVRHQPTGETGVSLSYAVAKGWRGLGLGSLMAAVALLDGVQLLQQGGRVVSSVWAEIRPENEHSIRVAKHLALSPVHPGVGEVVVFGGDLDVCLNAARCQVSTREAALQKALDAPLVDAEPAQACG